MSSSLKQRTLTAVVGLPIIFCTIFLLPQKNHLAFSILVTFVSACGCWELKNNLIKKKIDTPPTAYFGMLLPIVELFNINYFPTVEITRFALAAFVGISFLVEIFNGAKDNFEHSLMRIACTILNIVYPGLFMVYGIRLCYLPDAQTMITTFICVVLGSDTLAYFTGMGFGKNNKGFIKCSPNKSIAGFIGGTILVGVIGAVISLIWPDLYPFSPLTTFLLFFFTAVFGTAGDLFESMLKRSCGVKDAGVMVPGRGGMLDCIDSISIAVPIFVIGVELILVW